METRKPVSLAIVGPFSSGKSTLLNALVGETVQSMGVLPETSMLSHLTWGATRSGRIHMADGRIVEGTIEEIRARVVEIEGGGGAGAVDHVEHSLPHAFLQHLHLWDTPGLNSAFLHHEIVAERAIRTADIILWVTPIDAAITREEVEKIAKRKPPKTPMLVVVNKIDVADAGELADALVGIHKDLDGVATDVQPVAARSALDRARGAAAEFGGDDGIEALRRAIVNLVAAVDGERARPAEAKAVARLKPNEFECPACGEVCEFTDRYCVCGRELADQHRECLRCGGDNIVRRERCRQCNIVFSVAAESDKIERQALEDIGNLDLQAAAAKLRVAVDLDRAVLERCALARVIEQDASRVHDLIVSAEIYLANGDSEWVAEARRAADVLRESRLSTRVRECLNAKPNANREGSVTLGVRAELYANVPWRRGPEAAVSQGLHGGVTKRLVAAWKLVASMSQLGVQESIKCLSLLGESVFVCEERARLAEEIKEACYLVQRSEYRGGALRLVAIAEGALDAAMMDGCAEMLARAAECGRVSAGLQDCKEALEAGKVIEATDKARGILSGLSGVKDGWAQDWRLLLDEFLAGAVKQADNARQLVKHCESDKSLELYEESLIHLKEACRLDRVWEDALGRETAALSVRVDAREQAVSSTSEKLCRAETYQRSGALRESEALLQAVSKYLAGKKAQWAVGQRVRLESISESVSACEVKAEQLVQAAKVHASCARYEEAMDTMRMAAAMNLEFLAMHQESSAAYAPLILARDSAQAAALGLLKVAVDFRERGRLRKAGKIFERLRADKRDGNQHWVVEFGAALQTECVRLQEARALASRRSRARNWALAKVCMVLGCSAAIVGTFVPLLESERQDARDSNWRAAELVPRGVASQRDAALMADAPALVAPSAPTSAERFENSVGITMVPVSAGSFLMGSASGEAGRNDDEFLHKVIISKNYWMGETEVTQQQWRALMGTEPWSGQSLTIGDSVAATHVNWDMAVEFCDRLNERERKSGRLPVGYLYGLPSEAEWEMACRGGVQAAFCFGDAATSLGEYAVYSKACSGPHASAVRSKKPNQLSIYDMHGNVEEWCADCASPDFRLDLVITDSYSASVTDPLCLAGSWRVIRGGSWGSDFSGCRSAQRAAAAPSLAVSNLGFRLALHAGASSK